MQHIGCSLNKICAKTFQLYTIWARVCRYLTTGLTLTKPIVIISSTLLRRGFTTLLQWCEDLSSFSYMSLALTEKVFGLSAPVKENVMMQHTKTLYKIELCDNKWGKNHMWVLTRFWPYGLVEMLPCITKIFKIYYTQSKKFS